MRYRPDIDGLRALAIIPVLFFHAGLPGFSGGYVGVDIFFVISGFLIGGIILEQKQNRSFSYLHFYERRARRLLPTLFTVIACTLIAGYFFLMPENYEELFESAAYTTLFSSNFFFLNNINYFAQNAEFMPLLHTWSLAVEEQFYIVWPLILALYLKIRNKWSDSSGLLFLGLILSASFVCSVWYLSDHAQAVFYMLPFRLWELGLGTLVLIILRSHPNMAKFHPAAFSILGLALCLSSVFLLEKQSAFPGLNALPVCLGAGLLLFFGSAAKNKISQGFSWSVLVFIGKISYALYLWHWVIFAYFRIYKNSLNLSSLEGYSLIGLTFLLSVLTWFLVENPLRFKTSKKQILAFSLGVGGLLLAATTWGVMTDGASFRMKMDISYLKSKKVMWYWPSNIKEVKGLSKNVCFFGADWETAQKRLILWGDSHAEHYAPLIEAAIDPEKTSVLLWHKAPAFIDDDKVRRWHDRGTHFSRHCGIRRRLMENWLENQPHKIDGIILAAAWSNYAQSLFSKDHKKRSRAKGQKLMALGLKSLLKKLAPKYPVIILSDLPRPGRILLACAYQKAIPLLRAHDDRMCRPLDRAWVDKRQGPTTRILKKVASKFPRVQVVDAVDRMCSDGNCPIFIEGRLLYQDSNHIRRNLSKREKQILVKKLGLEEALAFKPGQMRLADRQAKDRQKAK